MKKTILIALAVVAFGFCRSLQAVDIEGISSGDIVPGEWNSNFAAALSYAEKNGTPLLILWSNPGCAQCNKMKTACNTGTFVSWRREKQIVMVISEGDRSSKSFAKNSSGKYPYMRLYWPAGGVDSRFTGRSTTIPASGSTLEAQLINYLNSLLKNWTPGTSYEGGDDPEEEDDTPGDEWKRARKIFGSINDDAGNVAGRLIVSAGKLNAKKGIAKVKVQIQDLNGKLKTLGSKDFKVKGTTTGNVSSIIGNAKISIKGSTLSGTVVYYDVSYEVSSRKTGGSIDDGTLYFMLKDPPEACQGNPVIAGTDYLPVPQSFVSKNSKWTFTRKGSLRYDSRNKVFVMSATDNPSGLKLSYTSSTGYFKGTFTVYTRRGERTIKRYAATVGGFMRAGAGYGQVTIRNAGVYECVISPDEPVDSPDEPVEEPICEGDECRDLE